ncbi:(Fe-S)-binding protein [Methanobacterium spitsbergense]|uniref:Fe-S cluster domain-containing protein n=1 Tax=Methanobacterium spitsbergense TaxID=2874285 RepID=A0A8T5V442_9EURY|nr:(Fe-S)-binding protein [Methanobacterium spitsbergense]MBZ2166435.1 Fe-S cluster domain-containing protein [Methanobacterium spitsbergense]
MEMEELKYDIFEDGSLVKSVSITKIMPCMAEEGRIKLAMQLDSTLDHVMPIFAGKFPPGKVNYIKHKKILTINTHERVITFFPSGKIMMMNTRNPEEGIKIITEFMEKINQSYIEHENGEVIDDLSEKLSKIGPLNIYNCLPQTNCEECGIATCMAFSMKLLSGDITLNECKPLLKSENHEKLDSLKELLGDQVMISLGWTGN